MEVAPVLWINGTAMMRTSRYPPCVDQQLENYRVLPFDLFESLPGNYKRSYTKVKNREEQAEKTYYGLDTFNVMIIFIPSFQVKLLLLLI